ncbi:peptide ABC transporter permease [Synergistales bacterium]|nr:peptide ABC transporter permease [Synergistales bacterium]
MYRYVLKRLLLMIPVMLGVSLLVYCVLDLAPGDAVSFLAPADATLEEREQIRHDLGLDRNVFIRYAEYMVNMFHGDLGKSYLTGRDVFKTFAEKVPNTLYMGFTAVFISVILSIPLGIYAAIHRGTLRDNASMVFALFGISIPNFWLGLLLILYFSLKLRWLPSGGAQRPESVILPAITLGFGMMAMLARTTRSSMLEVINQDYLRTARAKGVPERVVINKHALKNALIPIITIIGTQISTVLGGAVVTETVFSWPGVGRLIVDSLNSRDTPQVTGSVILTTLFLSFIVLLVDILYGVVDPRIKAQYTSSKKRGKSVGADKQKVSA